MVNLATPVRTTDTPLRPVRVPGLSGANIELLMPDDGMSTGPNLLWM